MADFVQTDYRGYLKNKNNDKLYIEERYSTNEIQTGKVWIDGKPIYQKSGIGKFPIIETGENGYATLLTLPNVDKIIKAEGFISVEGFGYQQGIGGYYNDSQRSLIQLGTSSGELRVYGGSIYSEEEVWITVEYTKK